jgi:hypothetical protein
LIIISKEKSLHPFGLMHNGARKISCQAQLLAQPNQTTIESKIYAYKTNMA